ITKTDSRESQRDSTFSQNALMLPRGLPLRLVVATCRAADSSAGVVGVGATAMGGCSRTATCRAQPNHVSSVEYASSDGEDHPVPSPAVAVACGGFAFEWPGRALPLRAARSWGRLVSREAAFFLMAAR